MFSQWLNECRTSSRFSGVVTTIQALASSPSGLPSDAEYPDLEMTLKCMAREAKAMSGLFECSYLRVIQGVGKKLFAHRTDEERKERSKTWDKLYREFVSGLSKEEREKRGDILPSEDKDEDMGDKDDDDDDTDVDEDEEEEQDEDSDEEKGE